MTNCWCWRCWEGLVLHHSYSLKAWFFPSVAWMWNKAADAANESVFILLLASYFTRSLRAERENEIHSKCLYLHKCVYCLLELRAWILKRKHDSSAPHAASEAAANGSRRWGKGQEAEQHKLPPVFFLQPPFKLTNGGSVFWNTVMFKQSSFSFMISLHHPYRQLHLLLSIYPPLAPSSVIECDVASLFCRPNQSFSLDAAAEHQKWLCYIDCSECFLIHFDKPKLAAAAVATSWSIEH